MRNKKGFTIVELMIILAILMVLTSIIVPVFVGLKTSKNEKQPPKVEQVEKRKLSNDSPKQPTKQKEMEKL